MAEQEKSSIAGLVLVGALLSFAVLMFLANFTGQMAQRDDRPPSDDMFKTTKGKAKAKTKGPPKSPMLPPEKLFVASPMEGKPDAPAGAPNVVMVVVTAGRRNQFTPYGAGVGITPFLSRVAARGARFNDVIAESTFSRAASTALFTGRHSWSLDMVEPGPRASAKVLSDDVVTLAEVLQGAGWHTFGATGNFNQNTETGLPQGFDLFRNTQPNGFAPGRRTEASMLKSVVSDWLDDRPEERPFFLFLDFINLHTPIRAVQTETENFTPDEPNAPYRASLNRIDRHLEEIWASLKAQGLTDNTLLVVTSDHGEGLSMPAHHGALHGRVLYDTSVVVPLLMSGPGVKEGHQIDGLVAQVDVMPTVVELAGLSLPENLDGRSWASQARGESATTDRTRAYSATWHFTVHRASVWTTERQCQRDFGSEGVDDSFADACYDRTVDPTFTNVITDKALTEELVSWHHDIMMGVTTTPAGAKNAKGPGKAKAKGPSKAKGKVEAGKAKGKTKGKANQPQPGATP